MEGDKLVIFGLRTLDVAKQFERVCEASSLIYWTVWKSDGNTNQVLFCNSKIFYVVTIRVKNTKE